jgi:hypothetical protein
MKKMTLAEEARKKKVSVSTLKRHKKAKVDAERLLRTITELRENSAGWNNQAGCKKTQPRFDEK